MGLDESYHEIVRMANDGIMVIQDDSIVMANPAFARMLEYDDSELIGMKIRDILYPTAAHLFNEGQDNLDWSRANGTSYRAMFSSSKGSLVNVELSSSDFVLDGRPAVLGIVRDISKQIELEAQVDASESRYRMLFDSSPISYFTLSLRGTILQVNDAAKGLLEYREDQILKRNFATFLPNDDSVDIVNQITSEVAHGKSVEGLEMQVQKADGRLTWISVNANLLDSTNGENRIALMALDIDRRKNAESREEAERARANLYLECMTHDLNNINQSLLFSLGLLENSPDMPDQFKMYFRESSWNVRRGARMVANLRLLMRLANSPPHSNEVDLWSFLQTARSAVEDDLQWKTLDISTNIEKGLFTVAGHEFLHHVFFNILHNSMAFDESNVVKVEINAKTIHELKSVRIEFTDKGPGIPDSAKEFVFRRTGSPEDQIIGRGLGLTLVDQIIRSLGGRIRVENRVGGDYTQGAKFVVVLPKWIEPAELPCGQNTCITFYKSAHCVFCEPAMELLTGILEELSIPPTILEVVDVDNPASGVERGELPMLPFIKICEEELSGFVAEEAIRSAVLRLAMKDCYPDFI